MDFWVEQGQKAAKLKNSGMTWRAVADILDLSSANYAAELAYKYGADLLQKRDVRSIEDTDALARKVKDLIYCGLTYQAAADRLNLGSQQYARKLFFRVEHEPKKDFGAKVDEKAEIVKKLRDSGLTFQAIGDKFGFTKVYAKKLYDRPSQKKSA